jgi:mono/diheme cytochrome c family protein
LKIVRLAAAILSCLTLTALGQDTKPEASLTDNPLYQQNCAKCHGKTALGHFMTGPSLISGKATALSADDLRTIITKGKHHMPKFEGKLTASDIDALVDQIKTQKK